MHYWDAWQTCSLFYAVSGLHTRTKCFCCSHTPRPDCPDDLARWCNVVIQIHVAHYKRFVVLLLSLRYDVFKYCCQLPCVLATCICINNKSHTMILHGSETAKCHTFIALPLRNDIVKLQPITKLAYIEIRRASKMAKCHYLHTLWQNASTCMMKLQVILCGSHYFFHNDTYCCWCHMMKTNGFFADDMIHRDPQSTMISCLNLAKCHTLMRDPCQLRY